MKNEGRILEILSEVVKGQDRLTGEVSKLKGEVSKMKKEMVKQNLQLAENSRAILKLADEIRPVSKHEKRITKLELAVFK